MHENTALARILSSLLLLLAGEAAAAGADPARQAPSGPASELARVHTAEATQAAENAEYDRASLSYAAAYALSRRPGLLFDMGRMHLHCQANHAEEAQALFGRFLKEDPRTALRGEAEGYLAQLRRRTARPGRSAQQRPRPADLIKGHIEAATAAFSGGQNDQAYRSFAAAYALEPKPLFLFDMAQVSRKAGHGEEALALFARFLEEDPQTPMRAEAEGYLAMLREQAEHKGPGQTRAAGPNEASAPPAQATVAAEAPRQGAPAAALVAPAGGHERGRPLRALKWVTLGVGLAAVIAGATLYALDGYQSCPSLPIHPCALELDTRNTGIGLLAGGGAVLGASVVMMVVDARQGAPGVRTAMLAWSGAF